MAASGSQRSRWTAVLGNCGHPLPPRLRSRRGPDTARGLRASLGCRASRCRQPVTHGHGRFRVRRDGSTRSGRFIRLGSGWLSAIAAAWSCCRQTGHLASQRGTPLPSRRPYWGLRACRSGPSLFGSSTGGATPDSTGLPASASKSTVTIFKTPARNLMRFGLTAQMAYTATAATTRMMTKTSTTARSRNPPHAPIP